MSATSPSVANTAQPSRGGDGNVPLWFQWLVMLARPVWEPIVLYRKPAPLPMGDSRTSLPAEAAQRMPDEVRTRLATHEHALIASGFSPPFRGTEHAHTNIRSCFSLSEHPRDGALAFVLVMQAARIGTTAVVTFRNDFADGTQLYTSNSSVILRTPKRPEIVGNRFEHVSDARELYDLHRFCVAERSRKSAVVPLTRGDDPLRFQLQEANEVQEFWVRCGYYKRTDGGALRFTIRGAILASWRGLFPWKQLTKWRDARRASAILARRRGA